MKRRMAWSLTLVLVLALALFFPAATSTAEAKDAKAQKFVASGPVYIAGRYDVPTVLPAPIRYATDEQVDTSAPGLSSTTWNAVDGASLTSLHNGMIALNPLGTFRGILSGTFTITASDGSVLSGIMQGSVSGTWNPLDPNNPAGTSIDDKGVWASEEGTGAFAGTTAGGTWTVHMDWDAGSGTYVGAITISGSRSGDR